MANVIPKSSLLFLKLILGINYLKFIIIHLSALLINFYVFKYYRLIEELQRFCTLLNSMTAIMKKFISSLDIEIIA